MELIGPEGATVNTSAKIPSVMRRATLARSASEASGRQPRIFANASAHVRFPMDREP
jgi:hypothetical protein